MRSLVIALLVLLPAQAMAGGWWLGDGGGGGGASFGPTVDATFDTITYNTAISTDVGSSVRTQYPDATASPDNADAGTLGIVNANGHMAVVDETGAVFAFSTGTGSTVEGSPRWWIAAGADAGCAAAGTTDFTPSCGRETCSNQGWQCHDSVTLGTLAIPLAPAASDCTTEIAAGTFVMSMCY